MNGGPWYIDTDESIHEWRLSRAGIRLDDGRELANEAEFNRRIFASHPTENPHMTLVNGKWHYDGRPIND